MMMTKQRLKKTKHLTIIFENVSKPVDETLAEEFNKSMREVEKFDEVSNFCKSSEKEGEVDEFKDVEKRN